MRRKRRIISILAACLLAAVPAFAVFNEKDLSQTLSVLRFELSHQHSKMENSRSRIRQRNEMQHHMMVEMIKKCNELSLILYSQNQDYTFDVTYALNAVTDNYEAFNKRKVPYDEIVANMNLEIERYERLVESLQKLPPALDEAGSDAYPPEVYQQSGTAFSSDTAATPFMLDEQGQEDRMACLHYAQELLNMYLGARERIISDNEYYTDLSDRLEDAYEYAQARYKLIQKRIFIDGQDDYFSVIKRLRRYSAMAFQDTRQKYMSALVDVDGHEYHEGHQHNESEWRGPVVAGFFIYILGYLILSLALGYAIVYLLSRVVKSFRNEEFRRRRFGMVLFLAVIIFAISIMIATGFVKQNFIKAASSHLLVYAWLLAAITISLLIRIKPENLNKNILIYVPVMLMGLIVITFRIIFIPNRLVNLVFPPLLLIFAIWQFFLCRKHGRQMDSRDRIYSWITLFVFVTATVMAVAGYVLLSVQVVIWWLFQLAAIETITAIYDLLHIYSEKRISDRKQKYLKSHQIIDEEKSGAFIVVTWLFDFMKKAVLPVLAILSIPLCINMAAKVFDLSEICKELFYKPFFHLSDTKDNPILHLSLYKLVLVTSLFFLFRYVDYLAKSLYRHNKLQKAMALNEGRFVHANQVNLTLANNVISILVWGIYIVACVNLLKIPMGALSIVAAGLATGLGLAMKDVLNNFIYGIQLMAGRLRVGDYIECDGVRGQVESINYQSTQIATLEGDIMAFTNTTLFNKNFRNLTKDNPYVFCKIIVGVAYGSDIDRVREVLINALEPVKSERDRYGRRLVGKRYGIQVAVDDFGDSSVNIAVKQFLLVESQPATAARIREMIYQALAEAGITIPFPQQDIYIKEYPSDKAR